MKNVLQQSLVKQVVRLVAFTFIIASASIYWENFAVGAGIATCGWNATAKAWIDENKNQEWDENELPLSKAKIFINQYETLDGKTLKHEVDGKTTDDRGITEISSLVTCNAHVVFEIYAKPPSGYIFTTSEQITLETSPNYKTFLFGFVKE